MRQELEDGLRSFLHPLTGGGDGQGWEAGENVPYLEIFRVMMEVEDVRRIQDLHILLEGEQLGIGQDARIPDGYLVYSQTHDIKVEYERGD